MTTKRASGGKRSTQAKHRVREAERARLEATPGAQRSAKAYTTKWRKRYTALKRAPAETKDGFSWLARVILLTIEEAMFDFAIPPEQRREQIGRLVAQAVKVLDPAKLTAELEELEHALEELQHARDVSARTNRTPSPAADQP